MSESTSSVGPGRPKDPAKREAILEAAKRLFLCNGYDGSSMEAIASEAGVSKLTVYSHFTDKETLFSEAVKAKCAEQLPALYFQLAEGAPLEKVLLNIARGFHRLINSHEAIALTRLMAAQAGQMEGGISFVTGGSGVQQGGRPGAARARAFWCGPTTNAQDWSGVGKF